jgi:NAD(P)-dependent dehydrogenase (short-subunit alcohol dehydrogenase family)
MDIRLDGKVALVTGASKGIGRAIAAAMAASGAQVMLSSRKQDALEEAATSMDGDVAVFAAHAGDPDQADACVAATVERFGAVDILVNNAATNPYFGPTVDIDVPRFDKTVEVNWRGPLVWTQKAWQASMQGHGGVVLNIASIGGMSIEPAIGVYNGTKAALLHLTRTLAAELAPGVRVNAIAPGLVKTDMARALWEPNEARMASHVPLKRLGEPDDIARAAVFLASDAAGWITGSTLVVDGGMLLGAFTGQGQGGG